MVPQAGAGTWITDGGMETVLIFKRGLELPAFASFPLVESETGTAELKAYFEPFAAVARERGVGLVLDTPTWRANPDWGAQLGYDADGLERANRKAVRLLEDVRADHPQVPLTICGCIGPQGDAYRPAEQMTADSAERYHFTQVETLGDAGVDMISALTMSYPDEATGIARAATRAGLPVTVSFTVETDGRLPCGVGLGEAIDQVDRETDGAPAYFMINCAHPTHFASALEDGGEWVDRVGGVRANASRKSHAELDAAEDLDEGDPAELADRYRELAALLPSAMVVGGCCGTDHRHVAAVADAWLERG